MSAQFLPRNLLKPFRTGASDEPMRNRPSSRLLVVDRQGRVLLFKFELTSGALAGQAFWATPGGAVEAGESHEEAARREMLEETGLAILDPGPQVGQRSAAFQLPSGETVNADERFFLIRVDELSVSAERWTGLERAMMAAHRWCPLAELRSTGEQVWPDTLADLLMDAGAWDTSL